jgi:hypothetical protein
VIDPKKVTPPANGQPAANGQLPLLDKAGSAADPFYDGQFFNGESGNPEIQSPNASDSPSIQVNDDIIRAANGLPTGVDPVVDVDYRLEFVTSLVWVFKDESIYNLSNLSWNTYFHAQVDATGTLTAAADSKTTAYSSVIVHADTYQTNPMTYNSVFSLAQNP